MEWLNENSGLLILVLSIIIIALIGISIWLLFNLRNKIAVQKLKFTGFYSLNKDTKRRYAGLTIGNKSLNDVGLDELGIQNGKVNIPLTEVYKNQEAMQHDARIVLEQRNAIKFELSCKELLQIVLEKNGTKRVKTLRLYAVDSTGTVYRGKIPAVKKLVRELLAENKD